MTASENNCLKIYTDFRIDIKIEKLLLFACRIVMNSLVGCCRIEISRCASVAL